MIPLALGQIATRLDGEITVDTPEQIVQGTVQTDSRLVQPGDIFVAIRGEQMDGHEFVEKAHQQGAALALVERRIESEIPQVIVQNTLEALQKLAHSVFHDVHEYGKMQTVAVTGSNGKTTTKNMLDAILSSFGPTVAPEHSFNNEVGAPMTVLKIDENTQYLVSELGASAVGEIAHLMKIAPPDIAIVLKVGLAHLGEFGSIIETQAAKSELVRTLSETQTAILNRDDPLVWQMREWTKAKTVSFSASGHAEADYRATNIELTLQGTSFTLHTPQQNKYSVQLKILGEHHVNNALAALATADIYGLDLEQSLAALENLHRAERWRMEVLSGPNSSVVINDAYNASPDSAAAALKTLAYLSRLEGKRSVAVFGEMADLGEDSREEHRKLGILAVRLNINQLYVIGEAAKPLHNSTSFEGSWDGESQYFDTIEEAENVLNNSIGENDLILFKSSKSANVRFLGDAIAGVED